MTFVRRGVIVGELPPTNYHLSKRSRPHVRALTSRSKIQNITQMLEIKLELAVKLLVLAGINRAS